MSLHTDTLYLGYISPLLRNYKKKAENVWNFSCPICGDSLHNKFKARGYCIPSKTKDGTRLDSLSYKCHNCGISLSFSDFLKSVDNSYFKRYIFETFTPEDSHNKNQVPTPQLPKSKNLAKPLELIGCPSISMLGQFHPARIYIENRRIPKEFHSQIFWTEDFKQVGDNLSVDHGRYLRRDSRIIIPFLDKNNNLLAIQGRSIDKTCDVRYITLKMYEEAPKIFGLNRLQEDWKRIYVVEGPFDAMFLPNCIALAGSDIPIIIPKTNTVIVYDNESVKEDTRVKIEKAIVKGRTVCIWPDTIREKDINDMILSGYTPSGIKSIIDKNTFVGIEAEIRLKLWGLRTPMEYPIKK